MTQVLCVFFPGIKKYNFASDETSTTTQASTPSSWAEWKAGQTPATGANSAAAGNPPPPGTEPPAPIPAQVQPTPPAVQHIPNKPRIVLKPKTKTYAPLSASFVKKDTLTVTPGIFISRAAWSPVPTQGFKAISCCSFNARWKTGKMLPFVFLRWLMAPILKFSQHSKPMFTQASHLCEKTFRERTGLCWSPYRHSCSRGGLGQHHTPPTPTQKYTY